jgi:hypothetical protein
LGEADARAEAGVVAELVANLRRHAVGERQLLELPFVVLYASVRASAAPTNVFVFDAIVPIPCS